MLTTYGADKVAKDGGPQTGSAVSGWGVRPGALGVKGELACRMMLCGLRVPSAQALRYSPRRLLCQLKCTGIHLLVASAAAEFAVRAPSLTTACSVDNGSIHAAPVLCPAPSRPGRR